MKVASIVILKVKKGFVRTMSKEENLFNQITGERTPGKYYIIYSSAEKSQVPELIKTLYGDLVEMIKYSLKNGDYLVSESMAIELKRGNDFLESTVFATGEHDLWLQMNLLSESVSYPAVIVQEYNLCALTIKRGNFPPEIKRKHIAHLDHWYRYYKNHYIFHETNSDIATAELIYYLAEHEQKDSYKGRARSIKKKWDLRKQMEYYITGLINTGWEKAKILINEFDNPSAVETAILMTKILYTKNGNPKGIDGPFAKLDGFGWKWIEDNQKLLSGRK